MEKQRLQEIQLLSNPENPSEALVSVAILGDLDGSKSLTIEYNPNYISQNGLVSYEWTKKELLDLIAKLE